MKQQHIGDQVVPYPKIRCFMGAELRSSHHTPMIHGLLEVDVSRARAHLRDQKAITGESLSFTAFLIACLAQAVQEHKAVQAFRKGSKHLILFDEVDVLTYIERGVAPTPYIIRAANHKTAREIHQEIRAAQVQDVAKAAVGFKLVQLRMRDMKFSNRRLGDELMGVNLLQEIPELSVPVFFFAGSYDYTTPFALVEQFYASLRAPFKKLIWFEHSAHNPDIEEPDKFQRELIAIGDEFCSEKHPQDALVAKLKKEQS